MRVHRFVIACCGLMLGSVAPAAFAQIDCAENPRSCGGVCRLDNGQAGVCGVGRRCTVGIVAGWNREWWD